jgi:hypothetical protein
MRAPNNVPAERMEVIRDYFQSGRVKAFDGGPSRKNVHITNPEDMQTRMFEIFNVVLV